MLAVDSVIAAPASAAWAVLVDLDAWPAWGPTVRGARLDRPHNALALHATGAVQTSVGLGVPFTVTGFEPAGIGRGGWRGFRQPTIGWSRSATARG